MLRHPLQRLFSAFYQSRRDRNSVNHRKTLDQFVESCAAFPGEAESRGNGGEPATPGGSPILELSTIHYPGSVSSPRRPIPVAFTPVLRPPPPRDKKEKKQPKTREGGSIRNGIALFYP